MAIRAASRAASRATNVLQQHQEARAGQPAAQTVGAAWSQQAQGQQQQQQLWSRPAGRRHTSLASTLTRDSRSITHGARPHSHCLPRQLSTMPKWAQAAPARPAALEASRHLLVAGPRPLQRLAPGEGVARAMAGVAGPRLACRPAGGRARLAMGSSSAPARLISPGGPRFAPDEAAAAWGQGLGAAPRRQRPAGREGAALAGAHAAFRSRALPARPAARGRQARDARKARARGSQSGAPDRAAAVHRPRPPPPCMP
jgi:hypothetical protein